MASKVTCTLKRTEAFRVIMPDGVGYTFAPNDGRYSALVDDAHEAVFLAVPEAYEVVKLTDTPKAPKK